MGVNKVLLTIAIASALSAAPLQQTLLDRYDAANLAYVGCMFATAREASADLTERQLRRLLEASCHSERAEFRASFLEVLQARGRSAASALNEWRVLDQRGIESVVAARLWATRNG